MNIARGWIESEMAYVLDWRERLRHGFSCCWTNGCFDILHVGHVASLTSAAVHGPLVVGLNSDASVRRLKGPRRPINHERDRATVLAALSCVEWVVIFDEDTPERMIELLMPDLHFKSAEYAPPRGKPIPEKALVESYGGVVKFLPVVSGQSTSEIERRIVEGVVTSESMGARLDPAGC